MVKYTLVPEELHRIYDNWSGIAKSFHKKTARYENYFLSDVDETDTPFDKEQLKRIRKTTGVESSINRIYSTTSQAIAYLARKRQSSRMVAINEKYKPHAIVIDKIKQGIMIDSQSTVAEEESIKDMLISGMGCKVIREPINDYESIFPAVVEHIHSSQVILDVNCTDRTLRKMQGWWIDKEIPLEEAKRMYQEKLDQINLLFVKEGEPQVTWESFAKSGSSGTANINRRSPENLVYAQTVWMREFNDKVYTECYLVEDPDFGIRKLFKENLFPMQHSLLNNPIRVDKGVYERKTTILGDYIIDVTIQTTTEYSLNVKFFEWGGKPYKSKGFIHFGIPMQQAYDSTLQLLLLHGYVTANAGYKAPSNSIKSSRVTDWEEGLLNPLKLKLYDPVQIGDKVFIPERDQPGQLGNFYPMLLQMFTQGLYEVQGMDPILLGNTQGGQVETFASLTKYETAAMQRIMMQYDHISIAQQQEGNVLIDRITSELKPETAYVFLDTQGNVNEAQFTVEAIKEAKMARYKVYAIPYEAMPTQRIAISTELLKIAQTTNDPSERKIFIHHALKLQDIGEVDQLLDEINEVNNVKQFAAQLQEQLKRQSELMKQTENKALNAEYREKLYARMITALEKIAKEEANAVLGIQIETLKKQLKEAESPEKSS